MTIKVQILATWIAVISIILTCTTVFIYTFDQALDLNIFPQYWEPFVSALGWGFGSIAFGSGSISALLSLYRLSEGK